jgi:adenylate kinase
MNIIITGPPAAGKGTMSRYIQEHYNIPTVATGEILRQEIKKGTELGDIAKNLIEKGDFVPDDVVIQIIKNVTATMKNGWVLDGFPRNTAQAIAYDKMLAEANSKIDLVIEIDVEDEKVIERITGRIVCPKCSRSYHITYARPIREGLCDDCNVPLEKRPDDTEEYIKHRLEIYHRETKPILEYYASKDNIAFVQSHVNDVKETYVLIDKVFADYDKAKDL